MPTSPPTRKGGKRYRCYVCRSARQRGWSHCPSKSLNAHDIESAVVEHIRGIGLPPGDPDDAQLLFGRVLAGEQRHLQVGN